MVSQEEGATNNLLAETIMGQEDCSTVDGNNDDETCCLEDVSDDLPNSLIVTSLESTVFSLPEEKEKFEAIFKEIDPDVTFQYFKSFKRARVNFPTPLTAAKARIECHQRKLGNSLINCYFAQIIKAEDKETNSGYNHLLPPSPVRQFLISPPSSPPVGWAPREEAEPLINYDLITALTNLTPGGIHEIHPSSEAFPAIVVHVCEDPASEPAAVEDHRLSMSDDEGISLKSKVMIQHTKRPPVRSFSEGSEDSCDSTTS